jgi:DNA polymerase III sliding clamp (beta) subunit (PCNA family)
VRNGVVAMLRVETFSTQITVRCIDGPAPNIDTFIPHLGKRSVVRVNRRALMDAVRRTLPFLVTKNKAIPVIKITQSAEGLALLDKADTCAEFVAIEPQAQVDALELGLDANFLLAALGAVSDDIVELYLHNSAPALILPDAGDVAAIAHVIMPCRL